jgi:hypothetical protein
MNRRCVGQSVRWFVSMVEWGGRQQLVAPDEPTPRKSIVSDHLMVLLLSTDFIQRLVWSLVLFIPLPPYHLRLLGCLEVQRSARHLEYHIQAIQVLNCSSKDLHMLCVCALSARLSLELSECRCAYLVRWFLSESSCTRCAGSLGA